MSKNLDKAIRMCDMNASYKVEKSRFDGKFICYFLSMEEQTKTKEEPMELA